MTLVAERIERPPSLFPRDAVRRERGEDPGGGLTLDDAIVGVWEGLAAQVTVACPCCGGALRPHGAPDTVGGRCRDCGTVLD